MSHKKNHPIDSTADHDVSNLVDGEILQRAGNTLSSAGVTPAQIALLDAFGKLLVSQLPASVMEYHGQWNADTNTPTLSDATGDAGSVYLVSVAGTTDFGSGPIEFAAGDWAIHNGTVWEKSINTNLIQSVNGLVGAVTLTGADIDTAPASGETVSQAVERLALVSPRIESADHTLELSDAGKAVEMLVATANTVTVPLDAGDPALDFPIGTVIEVLQLGEGQTTIVAGDAAVSIVSSGTLALRAQYSSVSLRKRDNNTWVLAGDVEAAS